jgi:hypothetical protein
VDERMEEGAAVGAGQPRQQGDLVPYFFHPADEALVLLRRGRWSRCRHRDRERNRVTVRERGGPGRAAPDRLGSASSAQII